MSKVSTAGKKLGTLVVVVLKARHLTDSHTFYKQDPYALIRLGETVKQTKADQRGGQHPVWDEEFRIPVLDEVPGLDLRTLKISAFSKESKTDELIGEGLLDISDTLKRGEYDDWVKLELNGAFRGEIYLEMTYYSADPPLVRRPSRLAPRDRLWRPPPTPPKETTSPYRSPQRSPQMASSPLADTSPRLRPSIPLQLQPSTNPHLQPSHLPITSSPRRTPSPRRAESPLPPIPIEATQSPPMTSPISSNGPQYIETVAPPPPRSPKVDPTLRNIPFLDVGPSYSATSTSTISSLHSVPSILRPRNVKSSPIPLPQRDTPALPPRQDYNDPNRRFQEQLAESDAVFAARLAQSEGIDLERLRMEEADAALARQLASDDTQGHENLIPGGWIG